MLQSGYLIRKKDITTPRSAYETCHAMKGMIRGKEENETHQAICMSVRNVLCLSILLPVSYVSSWELASRFAWNDVSCISSRKVRT